MAVTEDEVACAIESGAHSREAVSRACKAGGDCGACHGMIESMIEDHLDEAGCARGCCSETLVGAASLVRVRAA